MKKLLPFFAFSVLSLAVFGQAQVTNGDFSAWGNSGYGTGAGSETPSNWKTSNDTLHGSGISIAGGSQGNVFRNTVGSYMNTLPSIELRNKNYGAYGNIPAVAVLGFNSKISVTPAPPAITFNGGLPYTDRPDSVKLYYAYTETPPTSNSAEIRVLLSKWSGTARDTVGYYTKTLVNGAILTNLQDTIHYLQGGAPDTLMIILLSSTSFPATDATSILFVDDITFAGLDSTPGPDTIIGARDINTTPKVVSVYPNPAQTELNIAFSGESGSKMIVNNMLGQQVAEVTLYRKGVRLDLAPLRNGLYIYQVVKPDGTKGETGRFVVAK